MNERISSVMRVWAFRICEGDVFGRFYVRRPFKIYVEWNPLNNRGRRWKVFISKYGFREQAVGNTLASALASLYYVISNNYAYIDVYQNLFKTVYSSAHRF